MLVAQRLDGSSVAFSDERTSKVYLLVARRLVSIRDVAVVLNFSCYATA